MILTLAAFKRGVFSDSLTESGIGYRACVGRTEHPAHSRSPWSNTGRQPKEQRLEDGEEPGFKGRARKDTGRGYPRLISEGFSSRLPRLWSREALEPVRGQAHRSLTINGTSTLLNLRESGPLSVKDRGALQHYSHFEQTWV